MKVRYGASCTYCRGRLPQGSSAVRAFSGFWHYQCYLKWEKYRESYRGPRVRP